MENLKFKTVDEYFSFLPSDVLDRMNAIRQEIRKMAPEAEEVISYNMPALRYRGILVYFAAFEKHIGFYPTPAAMLKFENELRDYKRAKGSVQFPHHKPLPLDLIRRMTKYRYDENQEKR